ncbi:MAG: DsrE family protein [Vulcanimicrobiota bacterium]
MKKLLLASLLALTLSLSASAETLLVHLSHCTDDLHAASMALKIATVGAQNGLDVVLFVDREGVRLVDKRQPLDLQWGGSTPLDALYDNYAKSGGKTLVCPHCADAAGITSENLREGAQFLDADSMAKMILEADKVFDY